MPGINPVNRETTAMDDEYRLRKDYFRSTYYGHSEKPESMHSGWASTNAQLGAYRYFLDFINKDGTVMDLGCGNGRLLKFLCDSVASKLIPYGVDFLDESILEARQAVLPAFAANFYVDNVYEFAQRDLGFTFLITNLVYVSRGHQQEFLKNCYESTEPGGRLLIYDYIESKDFDVFADSLSKLKRPCSKLVTSSNVTIACYERA